jgi:SSS family solute:Na+ symporter
MRVTQITMVIVGLIAMFAALFNTTSLITILTFSFTLRAAGTFFPYVLGHYWKGGSAAGTIAALITGSAVVLYLEKISGGMLFGVKFSQPIIPGLVVGLVFFLIFSKIMPPKEFTTELAPEED